MIFGTMAFMAASIAALLISKLRLGHISPMLWLTTAMIIGFGAITIYTQDAEWIRHKPTAVYLLFAIIRGGVARGEPGAGLGSADRWAAFEAAKLDDLREPGESRSAFMLRYTLTHPDVHTIIAGTLQPEHLKENVQAVLRGPLSADVYQ